MKRAMRLRKFSETKVAADVIVERKVSDTGDYLKDFEILLIKRKNMPYKDFWALPGGFVELNESAENAARREIKEEASIEIELKFLLGVYSEPGRDPRGHVISICYVAQPKNEHGKEAIAGSDAKEARFFKLEDALKLKLAFDHAKIIKDYIDVRFRGN